MAQGEPEAGAAAAKAKFSFSMAKVSSHRRPPLPPKAPPPVVEYVTSVDVEAGVVVANPSGAARGVRVVPKQEDSWRPEKRMKNIMQEADASRPTEETFEMETTDHAGPKPNVVYGLTVMSSSRGEDAVVVERRLSLRELEDQKLRDDLMNLPEEATLEKYDELPVEEFGEALLRGMGWEKGQPIGRNSTVVVAPMEVARRPEKLGLGAVPAPPKEINKKYIKPGESRPKPRPDLSKPRADTRLVSRRGVAKGNIMSIIAGRYYGLSGEVFSINDEGGKHSQVVLKLVKSGEKVVVYEDELADVGSFEEESAMKKMNGKSEKIQERPSSRADESRGRSSSENDERHSKRGHRHRQEEDERYSKRGHRHRDEEDERSSKRDHRHSEGEDDRYFKRGHRHSDGERRGSKDRSDRK